MNFRAQSKNRPRSISEPQSTTPRGFFLVCLLSLICHVLFFISLYFLHDFEFSAPKLKVVTVDLVGFAPGPAPATNAHALDKSSMTDTPASDSADAPASDNADEPASDNADEPASDNADMVASDSADMVNPDNVSDVSSQPAEPTEPEIPIIKPDVSLKSKPDNLKDLISAREKEPPKKEPPKKEPPKKEPPKKEPPKKEPPKKEPPKKEPQKKEPPKEKPVEKKKEQEEKNKKKLEQDLAKAQKEQAEKIEKQGQDQLRKALERMKASVASRGNGGQGTNSRSNGGAGATGSRGGGGVGGVGGGGGVGEAGPLTLYQMVIKSAIEQNWVFNDAMAGLNKDLEVRIFIKILKSGDIRDISFETRSGNNYLDESAKKAIQRANPLPELPRGMSSYELVLGFSPRGLK